MVCDCNFILELYILNVSKGTDKNGAIKDAFPISEGIRRSQKIIIG